MIDAPEKPNIRDLIIPKEPPKVPFDVDRDIPQDVRDWLFNAPIASNDYDPFPGIKTMGHLLILFPERIEEFDGVMEKRFARIGNAEPKELAECLLASAGRTRAAIEKNQHFQMISSLPYIQRQFDRAAETRHAPKDIPPLVITAWILLPPADFEKIQHNPLYKKLVEERIEMDREKMDSSWPFTVAHIALKLLTDLQKSHLTQEEWERLHEKLLQSHVDRESKPIEAILTTASHMKMLAAQELRMTERGLELTMPGTPLEPEASQPPAVLKF